MLIICNGMYRAGSTLQYNIIKLLLDSTDNGSAHGFYEAEKIENEEGIFEKWESDSEYHVIKMHDLYHRRSKAGPKQCKIIYIYRDIRDVAVSLKMKLKLDDKRLVQMLDHAVEVSNVIQSEPSALCQKYEVVQSNLKSAITQIVDYLEISVDEDTVNMIEEKCSISSVERAIMNSNKLTYKRRMMVFLNKLGFKNLIYDESTLLHHNHISLNKGASGIWKTMLSNEEKEEFTNRYAEWLNKRGYI